MEIAIIPQGVIQEIALNPIIQVQEAYEFLGLFSIDDETPYEFIGFWKQHLYHSDSAQQMTKYSVSNALQLM